MLCKEIHWLTVVSAIGCSALLVGYQDSILQLHQSLQYELLFIYQSYIFGIYNTQALVNLFIHNYERTHFNAMNFVNGSIHTSYFYNMPSVILAKRIYDNSHKRTLYIYLSICASIYLLRNVSKNGLFLFLNIYKFKS